MKRWKCTVCGYIHTGDEPPDVCPVCKAPKDKFVEIDVNGEVVAGASDSSSSVTDTPASHEKQNALNKFILRHHVHPILVHMPNGLIPVIFLFMFLGVFLQMQSVEVASFYNLIFLLIAMPAVMFTGYIEWKNRYHGAKTALFVAKISCSLVVLTTIIILACWRFFDPGVVAPTSQTRWIYILIGLIMLVATGITGLLGGKLVFGTRDK
jgi:uncharacterized membrane protein/rubredoxin